MATIRKFADIKAWQEGRKLAVDVSTVTRKGEFARDFGLRDQLCRAVVSINSNIAEGFERDSNMEFVKFLGYAKGSAGEALSQLITAHDIGYLDDNDFTQLVGRVEHISGQLARLRSVLLSAPQKGIRWKKPQACENPCGEP